MEFFASCPEGFEDALANELKGLGLPQVRKLKGRVAFGGGGADGERACLWSRLASRIHVVVGRFACIDAEDLYAGARAIAWEDILANGATIAVTARGTTPDLRNTHFSALRVKDALCDRLLETTGARPTVDTERPAAHIALALRGERATITLDLSGEALFRRLPREATHGAGAHVLRPDYAALALVQAGWDAACRDTSEDAGPLALIDASCAGGGIVLEAASILLDRAPGLARESWGFFGWGEHDESVWIDLLNEANGRAAAASERAGKIIASDIDPAHVSFAQRIVAAAGFTGHVTFMPANGQKIVAKLGLRHETLPLRGAVMADTTEISLENTSRALRLVDTIMRDERLEQLPVVALARDTMLEHTLGCAPVRNLAIKPNNENARLLTFDLTCAANQKAEGGAIVDLGDGKTVSVLVPESDQFAARLRKVAKQRRKWAQRAGVTCYRVYDADLPDYSAAIDLYVGAPETPGRWLVIAEYAAPKTVDPDLAQARMLDMLAIAPRILNVAPDHVAARSRTHSRGGSQYAQGSSKTSAKRDMLNDTDLPCINEGGLTFTVNFDDHLDCGIFLDHRITRNLVREHAKNARWFLNLFAYTGTATCYAADAGVEETVTVDLSNTYLDWAERNMRQNGFTGPEHHFVRDDVLAWIRDQRQTSNRWDLIFCDPPTFSNSSKMGRRTWDVQRDHVNLLAGISRLLTREGEAIFSCNLRTFRPDTEALACAGVILTDITDETIPEDFSRNRRIHKCYIVKRYSIEEAMERAGMSAEAIAERQAQLRAPKPERTDRESERRDSRTGHGSQNGHGQRDGNPRGHAGGHRSGQGRGHMGPHGRSGNRRA